MTIRKGGVWGAPGVLEDSGVLVHTDTEAAALLAAARARGAAMPTLGLLGGDLCATMGGSGSAERLRSGHARRYPVDLGVAVADGTEHLFVAHVFVRRPWWRGRILAVMNAQFLNGWDLGPKSHPNDGLLDVSDADLGYADKLKARKRARTGTHLPHPQITVRRVRDAAFTFDPPGRLFVDGEPRGRVRHLEVAVEPDAFTAVI